MNCKNWKKVLILRHTGCLGDEVAFSPVYRELKKANNNLKISVFAFGNAAVLLRENKHIDKLFIGNFRHIRSHQRWPEMIYWGLKLALHNYDVVLDIYNRKQKNWALMRALSSRFKYKAIKISTGDRKYLAWNIAPFMKALGINGACNSYDLPINKISLAKVITLTRARPYIVLNPFGSAKERIFRDETLSSLITEIRKKCVLPIIIPYIPPAPRKWHKKTQFLSHRRVPKVNDAILFPTKNPFDLIALIAEAELVISPDTAAVHIAEAYNKATIAFYLGSTSIKCLPKNPTAIIIRTAPDNINKFNFKEFEQTLSYHLKQQRVGL